MAEAEQQQVATALKAAYDDRGALSYSSGRQLRAMLSDSLGDGRRSCQSELQLVVTAADCGVPDALLGGRSTIASTMATAVRSLSHSQGLQEEAATWAVDAWAYAIGLAGRPWRETTAGLPPPKMSPSDPAAQPAERWVPPYEPRTAPTKAELHPATRSRKVPLIIFFAIVLLSLGLAGILGSTRKPETIIDGITSPNQAGADPPQKDVDARCSGQVATVELLNNSDRASDYEVQVDIKNAGVVVGSGSGYLQGLEPNTHSEVIVRPGDTAKLGFIRPITLAGRVRPQQAAEPCSATITRVTRYDTGTKVLN
jgi:hypothetical protein